MPVTGTGNTANLEESAAAINQINTQSTLDISNFKLDKGCEEKELYSMRKKHEGNKSGDVLHLSFQYAFFPVPSFRTPSPTPPHSHTPACFPHHPGRMPQKQGSMPNPQPRSCSPIKEGCEVVSRKEVVTSSLPTT